MSPTAAYLVLVLIVVLAAGVVWAGDPVRVDRFNQRTNRLAAWVRRNLLTSHRRR